MTTHNNLPPQEDQNAIFTLFVEQSYWKLHQYTLSLLPPSAADSTDDLVQEAYSRLLEYIRRGSPIQHYLAHQHASSATRFDLLR